MGEATASPIELTDQVRRRNVDAYAIYCQWWRDHYGYECPISPEAWERWCKQQQADTQFDIDTERREGWCYDER